MQSLDDFTVSSPLADCCVRWSILQNITPWKLTPSKEGKKGLLAGFTDSVRFSTFREGIKGLYKFCALNIIARGQTVNVLIHRNCLNIVTSCDGPHSSFTAKNWSLPANGKMTSCHINLNEYPWLRALGKKFSFLRKKTEGAPYTAGKPRADAAVYHESAKLRIFGRVGCIKIYSDFLKNFWIRGKGADAVFFSGRDWSKPFQGALWLVHLTPSRLFTLYFCRRGSLFYFVAKEHRRLYYHLEEADAAPSPRNQKSHKVYYIHKLQWRKVAL